MSLDLLDHLVDIWTLLGRGPPHGTMKRLINLYNNVWLHFTHLFDDLTVQKIYLKSRIGINTEHVRNFVIACMRVFPPNYSANARDPLPVITCQKLSNIKQHRDKLNDESDHINDPEYGCSCNCMCSTQITLIVSDMFGLFGWLVCAVVGRDHIWVAFADPTSVAFGKGACKAQLYDKKMYETTAGAVPDVCRIPFSRITAKDQADVYYDTLHNAGQVWEVLLVNECMYSTTDVHLQEKIVNQLYSNLDTLSLSRTFLFLYTLTADQSRQSRVFRLWVRLVHHHNRTCVDHAFMQILESGDVPDGLDVSTRCLLQAYITTHSPSMARLSLAARRKYFHSTQCINERQ
jgi:hypothetical protein